MNNSEYYDINYVCKLFNISSRTLRFYEEKGIVSSTKLMFNIRRQYSKEQIDSIRNVLLLRKLGLSVKAIQELQNKNINLKDAIAERKAEIISLIEEKYKELFILSEALEKIESGEEISIKSTLTTLDDSDTEKYGLIFECSKDFMDNNFDSLYSNFSDKLKAYLPICVLIKVKGDVLPPLGDFLSYGKIFNDNKFPNIYYHYLRFEKMFLQIKYVFLNEKISGYWLYYTNEEGEE